MHAGLLRFKLTPSLTQAMNLKFLLSLKRMNSGV